MFKRRRKRSPLKIAIQALWPALGWRRWWHYTRHRIGRLPGTPYSIAAGFAFGAAASFTPFMGFHILIGAVGSYLARASIVASVIGTIVGNPWTFPFIWFGIYELGHFLIGGEGVPVRFVDLTFGDLLDHFWDLFVPMALGGVLVAPVVWVAFFVPLKQAIERYQAARLARRLRALRLRQDAERNKAKETS